MAFTPALSPFGNIGSAQGRRGASEKPERSLKQLGSPESGGSVAASG